MRRVESGGGWQPRFSSAPRRCPAGRVASGLPAHPWGPGACHRPALVLGFAQGRALGWLGSKPLTSLGNPGLLDPIKDGQGLMLLQRVGKGKAGWCLAAACWSAGCCGLRLGLKTA